MDFNDLKTLLPYIVPVITSINFIRSFLNKNCCSPCFTLMTKQFISSDYQRFDNIEITYNGKKIPQFAVTTFVFWNKGKTKLSKEDYGQSVPYLCSNNCDIIDYKICEIYDNDFINLKENLKDNKLYLEFDAISKNQGFVINLLHSGQSNKDIVYNFKFNGIKSKRIYLTNKNRKGLFDTLISTLLWFLALIIMIFFLFISFFRSELSYILSLSLLTLLTLFEFTQNIKKSYTPYLGVPKSFKKYFEEIDF